MAKPGRNLLVAAVVIVAVIAGLFASQLAGHPTPPSLSFSFTASGMSYTFSALVFRYTAPVNYTWDFGDAQQARGQSNSESNPTEFNVTHVYGVVGTYTVTLSIVDAYGNPGSVSNSITVTNYVPVSATITATAVASTGVASVTIIGGSGPYYVSWNFGDGVPINVQKGSGPTITYSHIYLYTGTYTVSARVGDSSQNPSVATSNTATITVTYSPTVASMSVTASGMNATVNMSVAGGNPPYTYIYDWGDGSTVQRTANPLMTHHYSSYGTFTINVTVYDASLAPPKYLEQSVTFSQYGPVIQIIGVVMALVGAVLGVLMYQYRKLRSLWLALAVLVLLGLGVMLAMGVL